MLIFAHIGSALSQTRNIVGPALGHLAQLSPSVNVVLHYTGIVFWARQRQQRVKGAKSVPGAIQAVKVWRGSAGKGTLRLQSGIVGTEELAIERRVDELGNRLVGVVGDLHSPESVRGGKG